MASRVARVASAAAGRPAGGARRAGRVAAVVAGVRDHEGERGRALGIGEVGCQRVGPDDVARARGILRDPLEERHGVPRRDGAGGRRARPRGAPRSRLHVGLPGAARAVELLEQRAVGGRDRAALREVGAVRVRRGAGRGTGQECEPAAQGAGGDRVDVVEQDALPGELLAEVRVGRGRAEGIRVAVPREGEHPDVLDLGEGGGGRVRLRERRVPLAGRGVGGRRGRRLLHEGHGGGELRAEVRGGGLGELRGGDVLFRDVRPGVGAPGRSAHRRNGGRRRCAQEDDALAHRRTGGRGVRARPGAEEGPEPEHAEGGERGQARAGQGQRRGRPRRRSAVGLPAAGEREGLQPALRAAAAAGQAVALDRVDGGGALGAAVGRERVHRARPWRLARPSVSTRGDQPCAQTSFTRWSQVRHSWFTAGGGAGPRVAAPCNPRSTPTCPVPAASAWA